jgi:hypothetical protein
MDLEPNELSVENNVTYPDLLVCNIYVLWTLLWKTSLVCGLIAVLLILTLFSSSQLPFTASGIGILAGEFASVVAGIILLFVLILLPLRTWMYVCKNRALMSNVMITITPEHLSSGSEKAGIQGTFKWRAVPKVTKRAGFMFFHVSKFPATALCIPCRNFPSVADAENFYTTARKYWLQGRSQSNASQ